MKSRLPPLNAVRAFHAAARHLNLSRAAEELGVTHGAVSKQVISLEDFIGARLFERQPGGLALTEEGRSLRDALTPAFDLLDDAFIRFTRRAPRSNRCRVSTVASFAIMFLAPRMKAFRERFPDIELEVLTSVRLVDLEREEVDFSIRYGAGDWDDLISTPMTAARLIPVARPDLLKDGEPLDALIERYRRIQVFSNNEWKGWSSAAGASLPEGGEIFVLEDFVVALAMAKEGEGLALLPEILVQGPLSDGSLARFSETSTVWGQGYHIVHRPNARRSKTVDSVVGWFLEETAPLREN